jgi:hypothetical protein
MSFPTVSLSPKVSCPAPPFSSNLEATSFVIATHSVVDGGGVVAGSPTELSFAAAHRSGTGVSSFVVDVSASPSPSAFESVAIRSQVPSFSIFVSEAPFETYEEAESACLEKLIRILEEEK